MNTDSRTKDIGTGKSAFHRWKPGAWLRVTGPDAFIFLQGQFTNDLRQATHGPVYGLWLNQKARVLADSFVFRTGEEDFWVGSYFSSARTIIERLESYIVADDVVVENLTAGWAGVTVCGDAAEGGIAPERRSDRFAFAGRRGRERTRECFLPLLDVDRIIGALAGSVELSGAETEERRITARIPAVPVDIGPGELPNEGGLETDAISYTKGCYLGQEVIARLKSMGQVRRRLFLVRGRGVAPAVPAALFQGDRKVGELRSATTSGDGFVGLALLALLNLRPEATLAFASGAASGTGCAIDPT